MSLFGSGPFTADAEFKVKGWDPLTADDPIDDGTSSLYGSDHTSSRGLPRGDDSVIDTPRAPSLEKTIYTSSGMPVMDFTQMPPRLPAGNVGAPSANLYVCGLDPEVDDELFEAVFAKFGPVVSAKVMVDIHTAESRGFGFILFQRQEDAMRAQSCIDGNKLFNRIVNVRYSGQHQTHHLVRKERGMYVRNVPRDTPRDVLERHFKQFGTLETFEMLRDTAKGATGACIVLKMTFTTEDECDKALRSVHGKPNPFAKYALPTDPPVVKLLAKFAEPATERAHRRATDAATLGFSPSPGALSPGMAHSIAGSPGLAPPPPPYSRGIHSQIPMHLGGPPQFHVVGGTAGGAAPYVIHAGPLHTSSPGSSSPGAAPIVIRASPLPLHSTTPPCSMGSPSPGAQQQLIINGQLVTVIPAPAPLQVTLMPPGYVPQPNGTGPNNFVRMSPTVLHQPSGMPFFVPSA